MAKTRILPAFLAFLLALCLATGADARRWRWWHYGGYDRSDRAERSSDDSSRRARAGEFPDPAARASRGAFGAIVARLISGCGAQADQLANLPYDDITRIAVPDDAQRTALEALRGTAAQAAQRLAADCPQSVPVPEVRLEAVEQAMDAATVAFAAVEPALQKFYSALDDEQKARLLRDMTLADTQPRAADRRTGRSSSRWRDPDRGDRRSRYRAYARAYDPDSIHTDGMASNRAADSVRSPPPCGEGSGVGVARHVAANLRNYIADSAPTCARCWRSSTSTTPSAN